MKCINDLVLSDDILFNAMFINDKELIYEVLKTLKIIEGNEHFKCTIQKYDKESLFKGIVIDCYIESKGSIIIIEVQKNKYGFHNKRANYITSLATISNSTQGVEYHNIPNIKLYVICSYDNFSEDEYEYTVKRKQGNKLFNDGVDIIYLNTISSKIPNTPQGDMLRYFNGIVVDNPLINKLESKRKKLIKEKEFKMIYTKMMTNEAWIAQEAYEKAKEEERKCSIKNMIILLSNKGFSNSEIEEIIKDFYPEYKNN